MATTKSAKIWAEMEKVKAKISDQQTRLKELEQKHKEAENEEIVDIVRGMSIPLDELPLLLQKLRGTSGQAGAVDKVPEIKRQGRFQARKKMPFGITLSV